MVRDQIGARWTGWSDQRPNFNVVFRAPGLDTHLGPAVQYWVVGGPTTGADRPARPERDLVGDPSRHRRGTTGAATRAELITGLIGRPAACEVLATDPWEARMLVADRFAAGRVFLAGEAAHVNPPWGGHGFNTSIGDAVNIAWKIAAVEHGWAPPELLASYAAERRGVAEQTVASAESNMRALSGDLPADAAAIQRVKRFEFYSLGLVLGYSYAGSPLIQPGASPPPATDSAPPTRRRTRSGREPRLPHAWFPDGTSLYDRLGTGFTLLGRAGRGSAPGHARPRARHPAHARGTATGLSVARWTSCWYGRISTSLGRASDPDHIDLDLGDRAQPRRGREEGTMKTALTDVRVFDGRQLVPGRTVVIEDGLIGSRSGRRTRHRRRRPGAAAGPDRRARAHRRTRAAGRAGSATA